MKVQYSFEREFEELMSDLLSKYGYEMFQMDGLGDQLDVVKFTEDFVRRGIIESTIDANANVRVTNISTYFIEISKPHTYLYSLYRIWQR